jgi:hypothetical protein
MARSTTAIEMHGLDIAGQNGRIEFCGLRSPLTTTGKDGMLPSDVWLYEAM